MSNVKVSDTELLLTIQNLGPSTAGAIGKAVGLDGRTLKHRLRNMVKCAMLVVDVDRHSQKYSLPEDDSAIGYLVVHELRQDDHRSWRILDQNRDFLRAVDNRDDALEQATALCPELNAKGVTFEIEY